MKNAIAPMALDYRILWTMLGGNLGGLLLTVAYFRFLHPAVLQHERRDLPEPECQATDAPFPVRAGQGSRAGVEVFGLS